IKECVGANWIVMGSNSVLNLSGLTNIMGAECTFPEIQVTDGGRLQAVNLATITAGPLTFLADGPGSVIDFSGLRICAGKPNYVVELVTRNGGSILAPVLATLSN